MRRNMIETVMGGVVLIVAGFFLFFAYTSAGIQGQADGKEYWGKFHNIGSLQVGADVKIAGIKVGSVVKQELSSRDLLPVVYIRVSPQIKLTKDAMAKVVSEGLLGGTYLSLEQGKAEAIILTDGEIKRTEGPFGLEQIIGEFIFSKPEAEE
ncbi:MAG: outer membrane lipid asymmetry maintenance protein MlaD [Rhodospirillaceae bacterium]|nr:MAG: outer membrane lipid asymmetry maintenance protein MlaD [Rhodospirillaceae bacterium]